MEEVAHGLGVPGEIELADLAPEGDNARFIQGDPVGVAKESAMQARSKMMACRGKTQLWIGRKQTHSRKA